MRRLILILLVGALPACGGGQNVGATTEAFGGRGGVIYSGPGEPCGFDYLCEHGLTCQGLDIRHHQMGTCVAPGGGGGGSTVIPCNPNPQQPACPDGFICVGGEPGPGGPEPQCMPQGGPREP